MTVQVQIVDGARVLNIGQTYLEVQLLATAYYWKRIGKPIAPVGGDEQTR